MGQIQGGYIPVRAGEILNLLTGYKEGLRPSAIRLYLSAHLEANKQGFNPNYEITLTSLANRSNLAPRTAQEGLRELEARNLLTLTNGTITFNPDLTPESEPYRKDLGTKETRPTPIPKHILETLAPHDKGSDIIGALAHLLRCLFIKQGEINPIGFVKNSLIEKLTGLCERAIRTARHWLKEIGFITDHDVNSGLLNKFGGCYKVAINRPIDPQQQADIPPLELSRYVENAPPLGTTPIYVNNDLNNQYSVTDPVSGIYTNLIKNPTLTDIKPENLRSLSALDTLYSQALERGWFKHAENQPLEFLSAAVRAITTPSRDPVRVFVSLVKGRLTSHITQAQEARAQEKLSRYRRQHPEAFRPEKQFPPSPLPTPKARPPSPPTRSILETIKGVLPLNLFSQLEAKLRNPAPTYPNA